MLTLIYAESALETVPKELWQHSAIKKYAEKKGKPPQFLILDRSYHHSAMRQLADNEKRGRPDIVHFSLLEALGSPLCKNGLLRVYVHTLDDNVISVNPETRLPRNYDRFIGLMEQLFESGQIPPEGSPLLTLERNVSLSKLTKSLKPDYTIVFSQDGALKTMEQAISGFSEKKNFLAIVGGFPHGTFSEPIEKLADQVVSIDRETLEAWTVSTRVIYEYERAIGLPVRRLREKNH